MKKKTIINGEQFVHGGSNGDYIRFSGLGEPNEDIVKISEMDDNEEIIITGKQLKELQAFWREQ